MTATDASPSRNPLSPPLAIVTLLLTGCGGGATDGLTTGKDFNRSAESDSAFCARLGAECGAKVGTDNRGRLRTVGDCGACTLPKVCAGGGIENACGVPGLVITSALQFDKSSANAGDTVTGTVTYKNTTSASIDVGQVVITARPPSGTHAGGPYGDFSPRVDARIIAAGESLTLTASRTFTADDTTGTWDGYSTYSHAGVSYDGPSVYFTLGGVADTQAPTISSFSLPSMASSLTVALNLSATDNVGVTGYYLSENDALPTSPSWASTKPASFTFAGEGARTLYAWVRDAVGNISARSTANTSIIVVPQVAMPSFTPPGGTVSPAAILVTIACATSSATIHYTINGNPPTAASPTYSSAIPVSTTTTIRAIAVRSGYTDSAEAVAIFTIGQAVSSHLGINTGFWSTWDIQPTADAMKTARVWSATGGQWSTPVSFDAEGWPTSDAATVIYEGPQADWPGVYKLRFRGQATLVTENFAVSNLSYDEASNITTADVTIGASGGNPIVHFTNTKREHDSPTNTGITAVSLMRPTTAFGVDLWNPAFIQSVAPFSVIRTMHAMKDANPMVTWSQRRLPREAGWANGLGTKLDVGIPFEYVVLLANTLGKDVWFNVPFHADDDAITKMAQLFEYGSDGVLPYTGPYNSTSNAANPRPAQHDPATWTPAVTAWYPPLAAGRHVYVELCNELWNYVYAHATVLANEAQTAYAAGDPDHYGVFGTDNPGYLRLARHGHLHVRMADLFRAVVGDCKMGTTYRMILASQLGWGDVLRGPLTYIQVVYGGHSNSGVVPGAIVTPEDGGTNSYGNPAWPATRYVWALAGAPYVNGDTFAAQHDQLVTTWTSLMEAAKGYADAAGVQLITYEGGSESHLGFTDPGLKTALIDVVHAWMAAAGSSSIWVHYVISGDSGLGLSPSIANINPTTYPRWDAINQLASEYP